MLATTVKMARVSRVSASVTLALFLGGSAALVTGCATVPDEVVKLSSVVGQDTFALKQSYLELIHRHFDALRADRERYLEDEWEPRYIRRWVEEGRLVETARGEVVWSVGKQDFVLPTSRDADSDLVQTVRFWSETAIADLQDKRTKLLQPLNEQEAELLSAVDSAFDQISRGNAMITAHLNGLRKVQSVQNELLQALNIKDLRDRINSTIVSASNQAAKGLSSVRKADGFVDKAAEFLRSTAPQPQPQPTTLREPTNGQ